MQRMQRMQRMQKMRRRHKVIQIVHIHIKMRVQMHWGDITNVFVRGEMWFLYALGMFKK